jgi:cytochrome oxidase Cu insertion factor (SCO1/SenC/PrrC family)
VLRRPVQDLLNHTKWTEQMNRLWAVAFGLLVATGGASASDPAPEDKTGLKVGEKAPEFCLKDQSGAERSLATLLKDGKVALVFYRSASW